MKRQLQELGYDVLWPYEFFNQNEVASWDETVSKRIMEGCREALENCDLVLALLDGTQVDDGTAWNWASPVRKAFPLSG